MEPLGERLSDGSFLSSRPPVLTIQRQAVVDDVAVGSSETIQEVSKVQKARPSNSTRAWMASQHGCPSLEDAAIAFGIDLDRLTAEQPAHDVHRVREEEPFGTGAARPSSASRSARGSCR